MSSYTIQWKYMQHDLESSQARKIAVLDREYEQDSSRHISKQMTSKFLEYRGRLPFNGSCAA
jgi:hypothetical protein